MLHQFPGYHASRSQRRAWAVAPTVAQVLSVEHGGDDKDTPLTAAVHKVNLEVVNILLQHGISITNCGKRPVCVYDCGAGGRALPATTANILSVIMKARPVGELGGGWACLGITILAG